MSFKVIRNLTSLLGLLIAAVIIWYRGSPEALISGVVLFMASVIICLRCILRATSLKAKMETALTRNTLLIFVAWQIAIVGALAISSEVLSISTFHLLADYAAAVLFYFFSYQLLSAIDSSQQSGGYKPVNFFGYPRSRKLIFALFAGCSTILPLTIMSLEDSLATSGWRPTPLRSSQACLLMVAIMSVLSAGLVYQRYRGAAPVDRTRGLQIFGIALLLLAFELGIQQMFLSGLYVYVLSAIVVVGCSIEILYLWQIGASDDNVAAVRQNPVQVQNMRDS
jgi:hypothetical protein